MSRSTIVADRPAQPLLAVIFDFDGVILDSETPEFEAHREIFAAFGSELSFDDWCAHVGLWRPATGWYDLLCARIASPPDRESFDSDRRRRFRDLVRMEPMPGVVTLLDQLETAGVPAAIASSAPARWVLRALGELGLVHRFRTVATGDDVERLKPAPDIYLEAARRLGVEPARVVAVEDSSVGLAAAKAAGMRVVVIPHRLTERQDLAGRGRPAGIAGRGTDARSAATAGGVRWRRKAAARLGGLQ